MPAQGCTGGAAKPGDPGPLGLWAGFHAGLCSSLMKSVAAPLQMWGVTPNVCGSLKCGGTGACTGYTGWQRLWSKKTSSGRTQPWKRGRGRGRQRGDREALHCGWRGHGRAHGPVEKVLMHVSGPERFGESRPLLCPLGWDRQASLCLSACFLDNSTSCMLPVRQETAPACETKGSRPCHLLTLKLLISWDDRRWQGRGTALGALAW